ncbi:MAG: FHA domain-containing protein [bacterium]
MIAMLVVTREKRQLQKTAVNKDVFVIGRSSRCDLVLPDEPMASRQHIVLTRKGDAYWLQDKGSRNGTLLNGIPLEARKQINDGDEIDIGVTRLKFILDRNQADPDEPVSGATRVQEWPKKESQGLGRKVASPVGQKDWRVQLAIVEGPFVGGKVADWESPLLIGRGLENHIVLLDDAVSISHARITGDGERHVIEDLDSSNGTFVDGIKVKHAALENGQHIKIGVSTLLFRKSNLRKQRQLRNRIILGVVVMALVLVAIKLLQPADIAGDYVNEANTLYKQGELTKALECYQSALKVDATRAEAKAGVKIVRAELAARETLAEAELAAAKELYERAKELCYQVLRNSPNNPQARNLEAVIKSIENAKVAASSKNWRDAVALLEKAKEAFPKSALVRQRLDVAVRECEAEQNLARAKNCLEHQQVDMAEAALQAIPESSMYFIEAKEGLDNIASNRKVAEYLDRAKAKYQKGLIAEALGECEGGLQTSFANASMLEVRDRIRRIEPLVGPLASAEAMETPDDVAMLWRYLRACDSVIQVEDDPLNMLRKRAMEAKKRLAVRLAELSSENCVKAESSLNGGNQREALRLYKVALQADTNNVKAIQSMEKVQKKMTAAARAAYQRGIVHEELGQADLARKAFKTALELSAPDEDYYLRASNKLKDYAQ